MELVGRTDDLLGAMRGCDCAWEAAVPALQSGTWLAGLGYGEARIAGDYRGSRSIWAPGAAWCPLTCDRAPGSRRAAAQH
jgi:hypothetical protein